MSASTHVYESTKYELFKATSRSSWPFPPSLAQGECPAEVLRMNRFIAIRTAVQASDSQPRLILSPPPREHLTMSGDTFRCPVLEWGGFVILVSSEQGPGMLLSKHPAILRTAPQQRRVWYKLPRALRLRVTGTGCERDKGVTYSLGFFPMEVASSA